MMSMTDAEILDLLKLDIGELNEDKDALFLQLLEEAREYITREGVTLSFDDNGAMTSAEEVGLVRMYAAWLFRKRASDKADGVGNVAQMPRMLQYALHNRIFSEHMREA